MPYVVRKGRLEYRPTPGNGPCRRRKVGQKNRRILFEGKERAYHATKGWRAVPLAEKSEATRQERRERGWTA